MRSPLRPSPSPRWLKADLNCHCFIRHAIDPQERAMVAARMDYLRSIGDTQGTLITLGMLAGDCPAKRARDQQDATTVEAPAPTESL
jgi:hypothetical protein